MTIIVNSEEGVGADFPANCDIARQACDRVS
jgi:hypothetical protein